MRALGLAGRLGRVAALLLAALGPAFSQAPEPGVRIEPVVAAAVETKPLRTITLVFRARNGTAAPHIVVPVVELPPTWSLVVPEKGFRLEAGEETVRLLSVFVPVLAPAGSHRVGYTLAVLDDPALDTRAEVEVLVLLEAKLTVEAGEGHHLVIAGDRPRSEFRVTNKSNAALSVDLDSLSNGPGVVLGVRTLLLEAGESRSVAVSLMTDPALARKLSQQVQLTASAQVPGNEPVRAAATTEFEVIPRVSGKSDYFARLPAEAGFSAIAASGAQSYGQARFSGSGALDSSGDRRLDFYFRGPGRKTGRDLTYPFGIRPDEYRAAYESPELTVRAGDGGFTLTRLTNSGSYGRGLDVAATFDRWSVRGYAERLLVQTDGGNEKALQVGWRADDRTAFSLTYATRREAETPTASQIVSLQSRLVRKTFRLNTEFSWDWSEVGGVRPRNSAFWIEGGHSYKKWDSQATVVRAGAQYHGYYENLDYNMFETAYGGLARWSLRASYRDQETHSAVGPYVRPFYDRTIVAGAQYHAFRRLNLSLDERIHDRRDLSGQAQFDYRDTTFRMGAFYYIGTFALQNAIDFGRTLNRLTRDSERLTEYSVSANYLAFDRLSLATYLHYRDQKESFTGDKIRRMEVNLNANLRLGRFAAAAFYRTAVLRDIYQNPLSRDDFADPDFLANNYDTFGASLTWRFRRGYAISFKLQKMINPYWDGGPPRAFIGMLECSVPVGLPVARNKNVGMLRGRIYDEGRGRQGVPGVIVKVNDLATVTDAKGDYVFNGLTPGSYQLALDDRRTGAGKVSVERMPIAVVVEGGRKLDRPIGLTDGASLGGRIVIFDRQQGGEAQEPQLVERMPLGGATVALQGEGDALEQAADSEGRFLFESLRPGAYTLRVFSDDLPELHVFERDTFAFEIKPGAREDVTIKVVAVVRQIQMLDPGAVKIIKKKGAGPDC